MYFVAFLYTCTYFIPLMKNIIVLPDLNMLTAVLKSATVAFQAVINHPSMNIYYKHGVHGSVSGVESAVQKRATYACIFVYSMLFNMLLMGNVYSSVR